jgi:molecular chaperone GrpE
MTTGPKENEGEAAATSETAAGGREPAGEGANAPVDRGEEDGERVSDDLDALDAIARERDEYLELAQRARADFENFRKRAARDAADAERRGKASLARGLLPAVDNLERALQASGIDLERITDGDGEGEAPSQEVSGAEAFARGVELVLHELREALARAGVEKYDPVGEQFDPETSEALSTREGEESESGEVLETLVPGYRLDGQVIRPARVVVAA